MIDFYDAFGLFSYVHRRLDTARRLRIEHLSLTRATDLGSRRARRAEGQPMSITVVTRREIFDRLRQPGFSWQGRLDEPTFLGRLYDLTRIPSDDPRFANALDDIVQHRYATTTGTTTGSSAMLGCNSAPGQTRSCSSSSPRWCTPQSNPTRVHGRTSTQTRRGA